MPSVSISEETIKQLIETAGSSWGSQLYLVMFFGVALGLGIIGMTWWLVGLRLKPIDKLEERVEKIQDTLADISSRIWTDTTLDNKIENMVNHALAEHVREYHSK